jgi:hypothetical protein
MRRFSLFVAVLGSVALMTPDAAAAVCDGGFHAVRHPASSRANLHDVDILSRNDAWTVGVRFHPDGSPTTLTEHWDGTRWSLIPSPNPKRTSALNLLNAVSGVASDDVWAVGIGVTKIFIDKPLIEHWDGTSWNVVPGPNLSGGLHAVTAISTDEAWAGGTFLPRKDHPRALLLHWNGTRWSRVSAPVAGVETVLGMSATGTDDVWAVGRLDAEPGFFRPFVKHWDGSAWSNVPVPQLGVDGGYLRSVTAIAADDAWAVGTRGARAVALHWDGSAWRVVPIVQPSPSSAFFDVAATGPGDVWAVGSRVTESEQLRPLAERWNGTGWTVVDTESVTSSENGLAGVDARGSQRWAVGFVLRGETEGGVIQRSCGN